MKYRTFMAMGSIDVDEGVKEPLGMIIESDKHKVFCPGNEVTEEEALAGVKDFFAALKNEIK